MSWYALSSHMKIILLQFKWVAYLSLLQDLSSKCMNCTLLSTSTKKCFLVSRPLCCFSFYDKFLITATTFLLNRFSWILNILISAKNTLRVFSRRSNMFEEGYKWVMYLSKHRSRHFYPSSQCFSYWWWSCQAHHQSNLASPNTKSSTLPPIPAIIRHNQSLNHFLLYLSHPMFWCIFLNCFVIIHTIFHVFY